jgi:hypothetical protein
VLRPPQVEAVKDNLMSYIPTMIGISGLYETSKLGWYIPADRDDILSTGQVARF